MTQSPDADEARSALISIVTAARANQMQLASSLTQEYASQHGNTVLPLFISAVSMIETILLSVAESYVKVDADTLWQGIAFGVSTTNQQSEEE